MKTEKVLIISRRPEIFSNQRLAQELTKKNVSFRIIDPESPDFPDAPIALLRIASWRFQEAIENLSRQQIPFVNSLESTQKSRNKWLSLQSLAKHQIPTPITQMISREEFALINIAFPFVLKELFSTQGLGVALIQNAQHLQKALDTNPQSDLFIAQKYIKECHGQDLRIFITGQGKSWAMTRNNSTGDLRSNLHTGGRAEKATATPEELDMAFASLDIFGLDYAGVDILRSKDGPLMIEVNPCPGFEGLESLYGPQVAASLVDLLLSKI